MDLDLTQVLVTIATTSIPVIGGIAIAVINSRMKDSAARTVLDNAITNSVGYGTEAAKHDIENLHPSIHIPGVPDALTPNVQYVLDHAGEEMTRLGVTPEAVVQKVVAKVGLANIAAATASPIYTLQQSPVETAQQVPAAPT